MLATTSTISLLISTYNWPAALALCLNSIKSQTILPNEVIIADDGSREDTRELINSIRKDFPVPLIHVWQEDKGFRLAQIRNKGIAQSTSDYIIQIDGDLILDKHFVEDHRHLAEPGYFITGSRALLSSNVTNQLLQAHEVNINYRATPFSHLFNALRFPALSRFLSKRYKVGGRHKYYVKGCNMSFWKKDLLTVNGYDENFTGWGMEDNDIAVRLLNAGVRKKFIKMGGVAYHLYHRENSRGKHQENMILVKAAVSSKKIKADKGILEYLIN
ncbi:glycosyltransferase family 2 protein [Chitinophaga qingshengii]|uniref:Glycosyltransferase family 2 protein n=1 Tax=Chitinophaga qingshengii TaxID=1569794 RepID=A0ABR7TLP6_9BACT|nr:glycosyltransferase family 2 protein [Chitinophaga qingshengii]MBC9931412.1 glycosyltransferase family 2 protein [Chitinophaga qingshengii]